MYCLFLCFEKFTQHAFVNDSHFSIKDKNECCGPIVDHISYAPICVMEGNYRKRKAALKYMIRKFFGGKCIVEFAFKVTAHDYS